MKIQILAPDPASARLLVHRLYPGVVIGEPVSLGPATRPDAVRFRDFLIAATKHLRYSRARTARTKRL